MTRFLIRITFFVLGLIVLIYFYDYIRNNVAEYYLGENNKTRIDRSFKNAIARNYDVIALGNSRIYRCFDPNAFDKPTYNFGFDAETFPQIYYKLKYIESNAKLPDKLIIGLDYWSFSESSGHLNYYYLDYFDKEYFTSFTVLDYLPYVSRLIHNYFYGGFPLIKDYYFNKKKRQTRPQLTEMGQYILPVKKAKNDDYKKRDLSVEKLNLDYFTKIFSDFSNGTRKFYILIMPYRIEECRNFDLKQKKIIDSIIQKISLDFPNVSILDYSSKTQFSIKDFYDITHMNPESSFKLSKMIRNDIYMSN